MLCESGLFRKEANWANSVSDMQEKLPSHSPEGAASDADTVAAPYPLVALLHRGPWGCLV